jgi:hypothetical protein
MYKELKKQTRKRNVRRDKLIVLGLVQKERQNKKYYHMLT